MGQRVWIRRRGGKIGFSPLLLYAAIELLIGVSGILVPYELQLGRGILQRLGSTSSAGYYLVSGIWVAFTSTPWCTLMGATIPVAMLAIRRMFPGNLPDRSAICTWLTWLARSWELAFP